TDRPTRQERRTRLNKRAQGVKGQDTVPDDRRLDWPVRVRDDEVVGSKPATPTWPGVGADFGYPWIVPVQLDLSFR
ncbi:hypothetical protein, partial [Mycobacterium sp.]|uniref:hypothetical protein n=1 Tax=Mycobacterium sp. TaxID=1785 RepID=UPI003C870F97